MRRVVGTACRLGRAVRVEARDLEGWVWPLAVSPAGKVTPLGDPWRVVGAGDVDEPATSANDAMVSLGDDLVWLNRPGEIVYRVYEGATL